MGLFLPIWQTTNIRRLKRVKKCLKKMLYFTDTHSSELYKVIRNAPLPEVRMAAYDRLYEILGYTNDIYWGMIADPFAKVRMHCLELCPEKDRFISLYDRELDIRLKAKELLEASGHPLPEGYNVNNPDKYLWDGKLVEKRRSNTTENKKSEPENAEKRNQKPKSERNADLFSKLAFQTRGNTPVNGKPNVYFACHPQDFEKVFPIISNDLLSHTNCAVWYDSELANQQHTAENNGNAASKNELEAILTEMQLVVLAVTPQLLSEKNGTCETVLSVALKNHIPVLPIALENGLATKFGARYAKIQVISKYVADQTATPYDQVLSSFLDSVLIKDEIAGKIHSAFDTRFFLSYRKKDREQAQRLMRLIHSNELLWDAAIWYDEFLVPGEKYNDAIKAALEESDLFLLAVTPNLLEEKNYVMVNEYPTAQEMGKPIVPVELVPTDPEALKACYPGLPTLTNEKDASSSVQEKLSLKPSEKEDREEHNYYIGLAYLYGIDVEVNPDLARQIIINAADHGYTDACEKLTDMYYYGQGVARDPQNAIQWQKKAVTLRQKEYEDLRLHHMVKMEWAGKAYYDSLWKLGDLCLEQGDLTNAKAALEELPQLGIMLGRRFELSTGYGKLALLFEKEGDLVQAKEYYLKSVRIFDNRDPELNKEPAQRNLHISYLLLARLCAGNGELESAKDYITKAQSYFQSLAGKKETADTRRDLSNTYAVYGLINREEGKLDEARRCYETAVSLGEVIAEETKNTVDQNNLASSYEQLGDVCRRTKDFANARLYFEKSRKITEAANANGFNYDSVRGLGIITLKLGCIHQEEHNYTEARALFKKAVTTFENLSKSNKTYEALYDQSVAYDMLGNLSMTEKDYDAALTWYEKGMLINQSVVSKMNNARFRQSLAESYENMADAYKALGKKEYEQVYRQKLDLLRKG